MINKKANVVFAFSVFIIVIVIAAIVWQLSFKAFYDVQADITGDLTLTESKKVISDVNDRYPTVFDGLIMIVFAGLFILGIVSGITKDEHPLLFGFMIFVIVFLLIAGAILSNVYQEMFEDSDLIAMKNLFPVSFWIISHLLELGVIMAISTLLAVMAKNRG